MSSDKDADDEGPRRRRSRDADDDRPRSRRKPRDDDDERPSTARRPSRRDEDEDEEDRPRSGRRSKPKPKQASVVGVISLILGSVAVLVGLIPFVGAIAIIPAVLALGLGVVGFVVAKKGRGRQGTGFPVAGIAISSAAVLISLGWIVYWKVLAKRADREWEEAGLGNATAQQKEDIRKYVGQRQAAEAKAVARVKAAVAPVRVSAVEFADAYDRDRARADALYRDKVLEVTGTVDEVDFESSATSFIVYLRTRDDEAVGCHFPWNEANRARLQRLRPGMTIIIRGICDGEVAGLDACVLIE